jgi:hypothetical protein
MGEKIVVGPLTKGLRNDVTAFNIDNDSFPTLINAYQWRGRVKRKRGTALLGRLSRYFDSNSTAYNPGATTITLSSGAGNLITGFTSSGIETSASIIPGTVTIVDTTSGNTYTDPAAGGVLVGAPSGSGTINYATGAFTIASGASNVVRASFEYYPCLPVMGIEDQSIDPTDDTHTIAFDTAYPYNIDITSPYDIYAINFYKNPPTGTPATYTQKSVWTPFKYNGQVYQQFWSVNYEGAFWACNGITRPFTVTNVGMQYKPIVDVTVLSGTTATLQITGHGLVVGDFVFVNEVVTTTGINFQTGYVTTVTNTNNVIVTFPNATLATNGTGGIAQYLTRSADSTKDCIRFFDGNPINGATPPVFTTGQGWVNFAPPLSNANFSIGGKSAAKYYLAGARMIVPFKDRLLFVGPVIQTSTAGSQVYLPDTVIYSQNGTPYYTASFAGSPTVSTTYNTLLVPTGRTSTPQAWWGDQTGLGGWISAGLNTDINTVSSNEDVLIMGFNHLQARFVYTSNDLLPFQFYVINSELGSDATFSAINLDRGVMTVGSRGIIITAQNESKRIDLDIPDQVFQIQLTDNGAPRICAARDFINEWVYFTYPTPDNTGVSVAYTYPTQTLQYNYRDGSWGIFNESYTTYGLFRKKTGLTWATSTFTWQSASFPWDSGENTLLQPEVLGGNQQGFLLLRAQGVGEGNSLYIQGFSSNTVTSPNHSLSEGDYVVVSGCLGTIGANVNGKIFSVANPVANTFKLVNDDVTFSGTYLGGGVIKRMYVPRIQTKQFPVAWGMGRKTRIGPQQYLFTRTDEGEVTLQIFLSQNATFPYNNQSLNDSLVYSTVLYTSPESTNLGLTPANTNLQMVTAPNQAQIWHRMNTSLIGDTVQIGFTLNDAQMRDEDFTNQFVEIELHGMILDVQPSQVLA